MFCHWNRCRRWLPNRVNCRNVSKATSRNVRGATRRRICLRGKIVRRSIARAADVLSQSGQRGLCRDRWNSGSSTLTLRCCCAREEKMMIEDTQTIEQPETGHRQAPIVRPGCGWKHVAGSVWDHKPTGLRLHVGGALVQFPGTGFCYGMLWPEGRSVDRCIEIAGGNRRRGLMIWARRVFERWKISTSTITDCDGWIDVNHTLPPEGREDIEIRWSEVGSGKCGSPTHWRWKRSA